MRNREELLFLSGFLGGSLLGVLFAIELIKHFDEDENGEGDEQEIDDILEEVAVGDMGGGVGAEEIGDVDGKGREIETAGEEAGDRHDDVVNERFDDGSEGATDGDANGEVNDATAIDKFFELVDKGAVGDGFDGMERRF